MRLLYIYCLSSSHRHGILGTPNCVTIRVIVKATVKVPPATACPSSSPGELQFPLTGWVGWVRRHHLLRIPDVTDPPYWLACVHCTVYTLYTPYPWYVSSSSRCSPSVSHRLRVSVCPRDTVPLSPTQGAHTLRYFFGQIFIFL